MGVICTALGFLCIAFNTKDDGSDEVLGDIVCLIAAFVYGCYTTLIKAAMPDEENSYTALFFGCLGLFNSIIFGSLLLLVWQMRWEVYDATTVTGVIIGLMVTKALIDNGLCLCSDMCAWALACACVDKDLLYTVDHHRSLNLLRSAHLLIYCNTNKLQIKMTNTPSVHPLCTPPLYRHL